MRTAALAACLLVLPAVGRADPQQALFELGDRLDELAWELTEGGRSAEVRPRAVRAVEEAGRDIGSVPEDLALIRTVLQRESDLESNLRGAAGLSRAIASELEREGGESVRWELGSVAREVLAREEFAIGEGEDTGRFLEWLRELLSGVVEAVLNRVEALALPIRILGGLIVVAFLLTLAFGIRRYVVRPRAKPATESTRLELVGPAAGSREILDRAGQALRQGDGRQALVLSLASSLQVLSEAGVLPPREHRTNGELRRALARSARRELTELLDLVVGPAERVIYGRQPATPELAAPALQAAAQIHDRVEASS